MKVVGIKDDEQQAIIRLCMAILWIGNLSFAPGPDGESSVIDDRKSLCVSSFIWLTIQQLWKR